MSFVSWMKRASGSWSVMTWAMPSSTTGSQALSVAIEHRASAARLRALLDLTLLLNHSAPPSQAAQTGMRCGRPSARTVDTQ